MFGTIDTENGIIKYINDGNSISITEYSGRDLYVVIPSTIDGLNVTVIKKKTFLSLRFVQKIYVPNTILSIDDYAFARCKNLETVYIPYKNIKIGQDILKDCKKLSYICDSSKYNFEDDLNAYNDVAFLLAKTLNELDAFFLFDLEGAGHKEWFEHLDATISMRLLKDDMEDFSKMILCGEEEVVCGDDGTIEDSNPDHYKSNRVKEKVRIAFLRLLHSDGLSLELKNTLDNYLLDHTKGCVTDETWQVVFYEHGDEQEYYDYLLDIKAINDDNFQEIMSDMGNRHTEMKSYLIKRNEDSKQGNDLFSDFEL